MRVKLEWLKELVDLSNLSAEEIVKGLSLYSIEVENVEKVVGGSNLVVGKVLSAIPHADSDHLSICMVDVGTEVLQIICGAPNVKADQKVIVAICGAILPNGLKIKRTKIRGVESNGMICSLPEIGLDKKYISEEYQEGIYYFKDDVEIGSNALEALNLNDEVITLGLTPNRGDLLSMLGVAIEASAVFKRPLKKLSFELIRTSDDSKIEIINDTDLCLTYYGQIIKNVKIKPSPWWLVSRLIAFGIRPINNVVDITNYILALFGQPLHAFDYDLLGKKILVRNAKADEVIHTLDRIERKLEVDDIVITDGKKPVAIAGVMGGLDTEITEKTKNILLEAAVFDPQSIRKTSLRLGLRSDSSIRFEKGVDLNQTKLALDYAAYLLHKYADGTVVNNPSFAGIQAIKPKVIDLRVQKVNSLLGITISQEAILTILKDLDFNVELSQDVIKVKVPNRRPDINVEVDLIEEIAKLHGYEKLPNTLPKNPTVGGLTSSQNTRRKIRRVLTGLGLNEVYTYSLVSDDLNSTFQQKCFDAVSILKPMSLDHKVMRQSLLPGLVENAKYSFAHKMKNLSVFEIGNIYYKKNNYQEEEYLGILMSNLFSTTLWKGEKEIVDFYLLKGVLETLFSKLNIKVDVQPLKDRIGEMHPHMSASLYLGNEYIGYFGALHPQFMQENDLDNIFVAEIKLSSILDKPETEIRYQEISKVPSVERDIAIIVPKETPVGIILDTISKLDNTLLSNVDVFDVYTGDKIAKDEKSIAIKLEFSADTTLTEEIINKKVNKILKEMNSKFGAILRS